MKPRFTKSDGILLCIAAIGVGFVLWGASMDNDFTALMNAGPPHAAHTGVAPVAPAYSAPPPTVISSTTTAITGTLAPQQTLPAPIRGASHADTFWGGD